MINNIIEEAMRMQYRKEDPIIVCSPGGLYSILTEKMYEGELETISMGTACTIGTLRGFKFIVIGSYAGEVEVKRDRRYHDLYDITLEEYEFIKKTAHDLSPGRLMYWHLQHLIPRLGKVSDQEWSGGDRDMIMIQRLLDKAWVEKLHCIIS